MTINYNIPGKVRLKMQDHIEKMLEYLSEDINREASKHASKDINNEGKSLEKNITDLFHHNMVEMVFFI